MATIPEITGRLEAATEKAENASQIMYDIANGDASTDVPTASGPTPTLKKWFQDLGSTVDPMLAGIPARLDQAILSYETLDEAQAAAATLPDGQVVDDLSEQYRYYVVGGELTNKRDAVNLAKVRFTQFPGSSEERSAREKIGEIKSVEDYYFSTDLGNINNAISRAAAAGVKVLEFTSQEKYYVDDYVAINRDYMTLRSDSFLATEIILKGSSGLMFDIGSDTQVRLGLQLQNLIFSRETGNSSSNVIRMRNLAYWRMKGLRFYMDNKFARALDATSMTYGRSLDTIYENSLLEHVAMRGGASASGTVGGRCVENFFIDNEALGANLSNSATARDCAAFAFGDNVEATWLVNQRCHSFKGFMAAFVGTPANITRNTLNLVINPNVEATYSGSGVARFENSRSNVISSTGWISTNALPAVSFGPGASSNTFVCAKVGVSGGASVCEDAGVNNTFKGAEIQGYDGAGGVGVVFKPGCNFPIVENISGVDIASVVVNEGGAEIGATVDGVKYRNLSAPPIVGMSSPGSNKVRRVINQGASPYYSNSSSMLNLPTGVDDVIQVTGTAEVLTIRPGLFFGETVAFRMADPGMTLKDMNTPGGNIANGTVGADVVSNGRTIVKYRWDGSAWYKL